MPKVKLSSEKYRTMVRLYCSFCKEEKLVLGAEEKAKRGRASRYRVCGKVECRKKLNVLSMAGPMKRIKLEEELDVIVYKGELREEEIIKVRLGEIERG